MGGGGVAEEVGREILVAIVAVLILGILVGVGIDRGYLYMRHHSISIVTKEK